MSAATRDEEVRRVAAELTRRLDSLRAIVAELNALLLPPEANPDKERVITP